MTFILRICSFENVFEDKSHFDRSLIYGKVGGLVAWWLKWLALAICQNRFNEIQGSITCQLYI